MESHSPGRVPAAREPADENELNLRLTAADTRLMAYIDKPPVQESRRKSGRRSRSDRRDRQRRVRDDYVEEDRRTAGERRKRDRRSGEEDRREH